MLSGSEGVRASGHLPAGPPAVGRGAGAGHLLRAAVRGQLQQGRHEDRHLRRSSPGDPDPRLRHHTRRRHHVLQSEFTAKSHKMSLIARSVAR